MRNKNKRKGICIDCNQYTTIEQHHYPIPRCEGGTNTISLCKKCHIARHVQANDFARYGQKGGKVTGANPANYKRNLKQYQIKGEVIKAVIIDEISDIAW